MSDESISSPAAAGSRAVPTSSRRSVQIPESTARGLEERLRGSSFADLDEYVGFILARLLDEPSDSPFSEEDERRLRDRLRSLGYID